MSILNCRSETTSPSETPPFALSVLVGALAFSAVELRRKVLGRELRELVQRLPDAVLPVVPWCGRMKKGWGMMKRSFSIDDLDEINMI